MAFQNNLPSGTVPFSNQIYKAPDGRLWTGDEFAGEFTNIHPLNVTRSEMSAYIANGNLIPGLNYLIRDATSQDVPILVTAETSSTLARKCRIIGDDFTWIDYDLQADVIEAFNVISCAIRNVAGVWAIIDDVDHTPIGVSTVTQDNTNNWFNLFYTRSDYNEVVSMAYSVDETYARNLYWVGASVGTTYSRFELYIDKCYAYLRGDAAFVSNSSNSKGINTTSWNSTTGILTITTWPYTGIDVSAISGHPDYRCVITGVSGNNINIQFVNNSGVVETTATNRMIVYFSRTGSRRVENINANEPNSNIWVYGVMKKRIS